MNSKRIYGMAAMGGLALLSAITTFALAGARAAEFSPEGREIFLEGCVEQVSDRISQDTAQNYCQCVLDGFSQDNVSRDDVRTFIAEANNPDEWPSQVQNVIRDCLQEYRQ
ncbi:hypothetical protein PN462_15540 [Spirulina sp. CS-785/01]|uniref:hypothetical protein n=1 Tax=Spirulina sp. CS-785/01 TaxID=3021716 RepID=UPI00232CF0FB|nr:hypothetical protein [Spirulina sp. CS-785/01]MDB9314525.1 hypothetical protein [Spirulina sp. CS-785/01]